MNLNCFDSTNWYLTLEWRLSFCTNDATTSSTIICARYQVMYYNMFNRLELKRECYNAFK